MEQSLRSLSSAAVAVGVTGVVSISIPLLLISGLGAGRSHPGRATSGPVVTTSVPCVAPCATATAVTTVNP